MEFSDYLRTTCMTIHNLLSRIPCYTNLINLISHDATGSSDNHSDYQQLHLDHDSDFDQDQKVHSGGETEIHQQYNNDSIEQVGPEQVGPEQVGSEQVGPEQVGPDLEAEVNREIDLIQLQRSLDRDSISNKIYKRDFFPYPFVQNYGVGVKIDGMDSFRENLLSAE